MLGQVGQYTRVSSDKEAQDRAGDRREARVADRLHRRLPRWEATRVDEERRYS